MYWVTTKSSIERAKTIRVEAKAAGSSSGSRTCCSDWRAEAPRSRAASSYSGPIAASRLRTITTT